MTTERWALVPAEATPETDGDNRGPDKFWKQAVAQISETPLKDIKGSLFQATRERAEQLRAADAKGAALLAEVLAARDAYLLTPNDSHEEDKALYRLLAALDKLGPAQPCRPGEHHE